VDAGALQVVGRCQSRLPRSNNYSVNLKSW
jgi:hypothetical protein